MINLQSFKPYFLTMSVRMGIADMGALTAGSLSGFSH
jgi:hypothetical protein